MKAASKSLSLLDKTFHVNPLPGTRSIKLFYRLVGLLGPGFAQLAGSARGKGIGELPVAALGSAAQMIFAKLTDEEVDYVLNTLLEPCYMVEGATRVPAMLAFNTVFSGNLVAAHKLVLAALEVNYGDFFALLRAQGIDLSTAELPSNNAPAT